jgi:hypothetical protein
MNLAENYAEKLCISRKKRTIVLISSNFGIEKLSNYVVQIVE